MTPSSSVRAFSARGRRTASRAAEPECFSPTRMAQPTAAPVRRANRESSAWATARTKFTRAGRSARSNSGRNSTSKLARAEIEKRFPQIACDDLDFGIYEPQSGVLMARRAVRKVVEEFQKSAGPYQIAEVEAPAGRGHLDSLATWSGEALHAGAYIFACGPWLPKLFPSVLGHRIFPSRQEVYFFGVPPGDKSYSAGNFPTWLDVGQDMYGMPDLEGRGVKIASDRHGAPADPNTMERVAGETLSLVRDYLRRRFPALRHAPVVESRVCQYENTSNGDFLIDHHPDFENVWLVGGGSGHGFKHGPAMGEYVARLILEGGEPEQRFSLATKHTVQQRAVH